MPSSVQNVMRFQGGPFLAWRPIIFFLPTFHRFFPRLHTWGLPGAYRQCPSYRSFIVGETETSPLTASNRTDKQMESGSSDSKAGQGPVRILSQNPFANITHFV